MRITPEIKAFLKNRIGLISNDIDIYLFGSRADDAKKGGDIDILILSTDLLDRKQIRQVKVDFYKRFGWQKLDLVNYTTEDPDPFKSLILENAVRL
jgi:uncharacterized protein